MKRVIHRIQALGEKAAQLKQVVDGAPAVAAGIRDAVAVTAGQLQQLRADVQSGVSGLRVEDEERLLAALNEISASTDTLEEAGFSLSGVDVELGLIRRIRVRLQKMEDISLSRLRSLHAANAGRFTVQALFNALMKAEEMAAKVALPGLEYRQLIIDVGPAPTVRVCWRSEDDISAADNPFPPLAASATLPPVITPQPAANSLLSGKSSFFEARPASTPKPQVVPDPLHETVSIPETPRGTLPAAPAQAEALKGDWRRGVLDRFKKMPDLAKRSHQ